MKKVLVCLLMLITVGCGFGVYKYLGNVREQERIEEIKKGWYIEVTYEQPINVRESASASSESLGKVNKGEIYKVLDINYESSAFNWYKIEYGNIEGWVASGKKKHWVDDVNNPNDIAVPVIKYYDDVYKVVSINDINYKHLEVVEDTDIYDIKHVIYHEVDNSKQIDQYWILYTITDGAGKSSSKLQKIEFAENPDESKVLDFKDYR